MSRKFLLASLGLYIVLTSLSGCVVEPTRPVAYYPSPPPQYYVAPAPVYYNRYYYR